MEDEVRVSDVPVDEISGEITVPKVQYASISQTLNENREVIKGGRGRRSERKKRGRKNKTEEGQRDLTREPHTIWIVRLILAGLESFLDSISAGGLLLFF
jgi:hypothetical protein